MIDRSIKEIKGTKIVHKHSLACWFTILFTLLLIAIPVVTTFVPFLKISDIESGITYPGGEFNNINIIMWIFGQGNAGLKVGFLDLLSKPPYEWLLMSYDVGMGICCVLLAIVAIFVIILVIWVLAFMFKGHVNNYKKAASCAIRLFIVYLLFFGFFISFYFLFPKAFTNLVGEEIPVPFKVDMIWACIYLGSILVIYIVLRIIYGVCFKNHVYAGDVRVEKVELDEKVQLDITKIVYKPSKGLPPQIYSIGGHAYAQNTNLEYAIIPEGVKTLGNGAFSNCLNLQIVTIPLSVKSIGKNCFFNTPKLVRINYAGSKEQWRHISRGRNWLLKSGTVKVVCADATLVVNPYQ